MKYITTLLFSLFVLAHPAFSQENDSMAKKSFTMAQAAYADGQYKETVDYLKYADIYSGGATPRSLYLKIKALNQLSGTDQSYVPTLQSACNKFFEMTDKNTYPQDKYQEIVSIMNAKKGTAPAATVTTTSGSSTNKTQEQIDYDKAIKLHTKEAYKEFMDQYTYTPLSNDIKKRYQDLVEDDIEYRDHYPAGRRKK